MKRNDGIWLAFLLNLAFALLEAVGGFFSGSIAILSDAVHDLGDACVIGLSLLFESKSTRAPDARYPFGYGGYSVLGSIITCLLLMFGSVSVALAGINRLLHPVAVRSDWMLIFAVVGLSVNTAATLVTRKGKSAGQKAINLHMLEDVLGWAAVLLGAVVMRLTGITVIDPILSIAVAVFIFVHAAEHLRTPIDLLLHKTPAHMDAETIEQELRTIHEVTDCSDLRIWSPDAQKLYATVRIHTDSDTAKQQVRACLQQHGISDVTVEMERTIE